MIALGSLIWEKISRRL